MSTKYLCNDCENESPYYEGPCKLKLPDIDELKFRPIILNTSLWWEYPNVDEINFLKLFEELGYVLKKSESGNNEFRNWTIRIYINSEKHLEAWHNDLDDVIVIRNQDNRNIRFEGRMTSNLEHIKNL